MKDLPFNQILIEFDIKDFRRIVKIEAVLNEYIKRDKKIPPIILKKFLSFFRESEPRELQRIKAEVSRVHEATVAKFCSDKKYTFRQVRMVPDVEEYFEVTNLDEEIPLEKPYSVKKKKAVYTLDTLLDEVFRSLQFNFGYKNSHRKDKKALAQFIYRIIENYCNNTITGKTRTGFTKYKKYIIIYFIMAEFGFTSQIEKWLSEKVMFNRIKYTIEGDPKKKNNKGTRSQLLKFSSIF